MYFRIAEPGLAGEDWDDEAGAEVKADSDRMEGVHAVGTMT